MNPKAGQWALYKTQDGSRPFYVWVEEIRDGKAVAFSQTSRDGGRTWQPAQPYRTPPRRGWKYAGEVSISVGTTRFPCQQWLDEGRTWFTTPSIASGIVKATERGADVLALEEWGNMGGRPR